jgi:hypothetical protein
MNEQSFERRQKLLIALAAVAPGDIPQRRLASSVVASTPIVFPLTKPAALRHCSTHVKAARCVSRSISRRVREIRGPVALHPNRRPENRATSTSPPRARRLPRSESMPSK